MSSPRAGLLWDQPQVLSRFIEDCGVTCELVTPQLVATPFFRGSFTTLVIPTGFGNREQGLKRPDPPVRRGGWLSDRLRGGRRPA